ncbi:MAG: GNAT family N-acetyltransferase [Fibrobacter sp.]|nr:GNAT family N-acetyltransferase [Fibrobacter sp.]
MENYKYEISNFNPKVASDEENAKFTNCCKNLFDNEKDFKYLSFTGIKHTDELHSYWRETFDPANKEYLIVKDGLNIVGLCIIIKDISEKFEILGMIVDADYRRKNIATRCLLAAEKKAAKYGFRAVHLNVFCDNKAMLINVIKLGYKPTNIEYHKRYDGEDLLSLVKYL